MRPFFVAAFFCASASAAQAASIDVYATASANTNTTVQDLETNFLLDADTTASSSYSVTADALSGPVSGASTAYADGDTGIMRAESTMSGNRGDGLGSGSTNAQVTISETYTISGSGTLTASILLDGTWDLSRVNISGGSGEVLPLWQVQSYVSIGTVRDSVCLGTVCSPSITEANSGSITDYLLTVSQDYFVSSGTRSVQVDFRLLTQLLTGDGSIDFGNTAKLLVTASDGLTILPSDPDFISDPAFFDGAVVPLPGTIPLILTGLGALGLVRCRRPRMAA